MQDFEGKVGVVTGAAHGIGFAFAKLIAQAGMRVVLADIDRDALEVARADLAAHGFDVIGVPTDVTSTASLAALAEETLAHFGAIDLLLANAGTAGDSSRPIWEATASDWQWTFGTNFWGAVNSVSTFLPLMLERGGGHIAVTASATSFIFARGMYNVSKHAIAAYVEAVYAQLLQQQAPVNLTLLCPGSIASDIYRQERPVHLREGISLERQRAEDEARQAMLERNQARGRPPEHAAAALLEGIRESRLYVFNDTDWDDRIRARFEHVLQRTNPSATEMRADVPPAPSRRALDG